MALYKCIYLLTYLLTLVLEIIVVLVLVPLYENITGKLSLTYSLGLQYNNYRISSKCKDGFTRSEKQ